jgi:APA family basic amino acid/polyamine antiporter
MSLFLRKDVSALQAEVAADQSLKRALGPVNLVTLGIGAIIGAGIFVLTGQAAANYAGPAIVYSFLLAGLACAFAGLCYAEFAAMIPIAGSAYTSATPRWVSCSPGSSGGTSSWVPVRRLHRGGRLVGRGLLHLKDVGLTIPRSSPRRRIPTPADAGQRLAALYRGLVQHGGGVEPPAMFIVAVITILLIIGISESATFNNIAVFIKITVVLLFIAFGIAYINRENWEPFIPPQTGPGKYGWDGIVRGAGVIFFAYIGFDAVSTAAQETRNPQKDMPIGILGSLAICTVLYIAVALVLTGMVNYTQLNVPDPIAVGINAAGEGLAWLRPVVKIGAIAGLSSVILVMLLGQPRIFYTMSKDGLLPPVFSAVHPKFRTPWLASLVTGVAAMAFAGLLPIGLLGELVSIGTLLAFAIVCAGVLVLRYTDPERPRPFRTPLVPFVPIAGILACFYLMFGLPVDTWPGSSSGWCLAWRSISCTGAGISRSSCGQTLARQRVPSPERSEGGMPESMPPSLRSG